MLKKLAVLIVAVGAVATAQAQPQGGPPFGDPTRHTFDKEPPPPPPTAAPEIDPASAMSAFTLLAGGLVMLRGRRSNK
jgi:hypothetical protein